MCITCFPGAQGGQKKVSDPLGLEIQMFVSYLLGAENYPLQIQQVLITTEPIISCSAHYDFQ